MKKAFMKNILSLCILSLIGFQAMAADKNDCSIGVCHFELISNNSIDQFSGILAALNKSADGDKTVEVKSLNQCKDLSKKQFEHMFFDGNPKSGKDEVFNDPSLTISNQTLKYAVINKDYIIREVRLTVSYPARLMGGGASTKSTLFTLVQDRKSCELKQMIKGNPFTINK